MESLEQHPNINLYYFDRKVRDVTPWESTTTHAYNAETIKQIYPMPEFNIWGPDDPYLLNFRYLKGISNCTVNDPILFHQDHDRENENWEEINKKVDAAMEVAKKS